MYYFLSFSEKSIKESVVPIERGIGSSLGTIFRAK
jgi:hypothetical protein